MAEARAFYPQFANLPEYSGSRLSTRARNVVAGLTDLPPPSYIQYVDPNVAASEFILLPQKSTVRLTRKICHQALK